MDSRDSNAPRIVPAHLSLLAIYNPSLGVTDETFKEQIVFYFSEDAKKVKQKGLGTESSGPTGPKDVQKEENEKLRQIGLAQGMVNFARTFSNGRPLDQIDTEKTRIVTRELESGWWILAAVNLTKLPAATPPTKATEGKTEGTTPKFEYSSREVSPPALLLEQLQQAHSTFLLHTGSSLSGLFNRFGRTKFCALLDRFWTKYALTWDIMLHGSPVIDLFGGTKLAAGGELGMGVGEEEWGSGEREVLEDFVRRTDGLVDMVVCRYGSPSTTEKESDATKSHKEHLPQHLPEPWMGVGRQAQASDGVVFSGMGMISASSLSDISHWMATLYSQGETAFGVRDSPTSDRRKRKRQPRPERQPVKSTKPVESEGVPHKTGIPRSIVASAEKSLEKATVQADKTKSPENQSSKPKVIEDKYQSKPDSTEAETQSSWSKYLTLGYGTTWSLPDLDPLDLFSGQVAPEALPSNLPEDALKARLEHHIAQENAGYFLIGLKGDPEDESDEVAAENQHSDHSAQGDFIPGWNRRMMLRTLYVRLTQYATTTLDPSSANSSMAMLSPALSTPGIDSDTMSRVANAGNLGHREGSSETRKPRRLRILVYAHRPFLYLLLFNPTVASLMMPPFYRHLHIFLSPLKELLAKRTGAVVGGARRKGFLFGTASTPGAVEGATKHEAAEKDVYEVLFDEDTLAIVSNLPCIPQLLPFGAHSEDGGDHSYPKRDADHPIGWTRAEALNVHSAALDILAGNRSSRQVAESVATDSDSGAVEKSVKTGRGWWIVWGKLGDHIGPISSVKGEVVTGTHSSESTVIPTPSKSAISKTSITPLQVHTEHSSSGPQDYFSSQNPQALKSDTQVILVRRAQNVDSKGKNRASSSGWHLNMGSIGLGGAASEAGKMFDASKFGIGFDARKYMESIARLGR